MAPPNSLFEELTVFTATDGARIGAKWWPKGASKPTPVIKASKYLNLYTVPVDSFASLAAELDALVYQPDRFVVRGEPITDKRERVRRLLLDHPEEGVKATLRDVPRRALILDMDCKPEAFPEPEGPLNATYAAEVWQRIGLYVNEFKDAACWWTFTGSAGAKPGVRLRFAVWLADPVTGPQLRLWAKALEERVGFALFDPSVFGANQPNFIAAPVLAPGMVDPCAHRFGRIEGRECGALVIPAAKPKASARKPLTGETAAPSGFIPTGEAKPLNRAAEAYLATLAPGNFNDPIKAAVGAAIAAGFEEKEIIERILDCVAARGDDGRVRHWQRDLPRVVAFAKAGERRRREEELARAEPHPGLDALQPLEQARATLREAVQAWKQSAVQWTAEAFKPEAPPRVALNVGVGLGKTREAIAAVAELLKAGEMQRVLYLVPHHRLSAELVGRFAEAGVEARVWYGAQSEDMDGNPVCIQPEIRDAAIPIGALKEACQACPALTSCRYRAQHHARPPVWIASHEMLFRRPPRTLREVQALIVDESFWEAGLVGIDGKPKQLLLSTLWTRPDDMNPARVTDLEDYRERLLEALGKLQDGEALTAEMFAGLLNAADASEALKLEWERKPDVGEALRGLENDSGSVIAALQEIRRRRFSSMVPRLWDLSRELLEGRYASITRRDEMHAGDMGTGPGVELAWRERVREEWLALPALLLDATARAEIVGQYFPGVTVTEVQAELPASVRIAQVWDRDTARRTLFRKPTETDDRRDDWRANNVRDLARMIEVQASEHARLLVIAQKDIEARLRESEHNLPARVELDHFGNLAGRDEWAEVDGLILIGRTLPNPRAIERMASVLFGRRIEPVGGQWPKAAVRLEGDMPQAVEVPRHPDPAAEAVRWSICEAGLVQAIGRARAVNRTAASPLDVLIVGNVPVPTLRPHRLVRRESLTPSPWRWFAARHGVLPLSPAALAAGGGFPSEEAAKKALQRVTAGVKGDIPLKIDTFKGLSPFKTPYRWRRQGQKKWSVGLGPPDPATARQRIEALIGAVVAFEGWASDAPVKPASTLTVTELRDRGASAQRVAEALGIASSKLEELTRRALEEARQAGRFIPPSARPYVGIALQVGADEVARTIEVLASGSGPPRGSS